MKRPIENNSDEGDYVYDPFCGSGTTIIAAERTGRKCLACELSPVYCDAIIRRWEQETGERAIRESDGLAFDDLVS
jgi:DNA modification methylase